MQKESSFYGNGPPLQKRVSSMSKGDFYGSEKSMTISNEKNVAIEFISNNGDKTSLKPYLNWKRGK